MPKGFEIRAGRSLLGWNTREFAKRADVDLSTIYRIEAAGHNSVRGQSHTLEKLITALEQRGVEFIDGGVRLTKARKK